MPPDRRIAPGDDLNGPARAATSGFVMTPIGFVRCAGRYRFEAPRQGVFAANSGVIELLEGHRYEEAAADLAGFERIWVLFVFHLNQTWNVRVTPPVAPPGRRIGVFATRSPHRPNRLGMSCVELEKVDGRRLHIRNFDLLDGTPVVDLKPYIPCADAFPDAAVGWPAEAGVENWQVEYTERFLAESAFIVSAGGPDLRNFCEVQLHHAPLDRQRKRLYEAADGTMEIGCRTWRIRFAADAARRWIRVLGVRSNYREEELLPEAADRYGDLPVHRAWREFQEKREDGKQ